MKNIFSFDKSFIKMLVILSLPIIAQNLVTSSLNLLDNVMIGKLGVNEITATGIANSFYMIFNLTAGAISIGAGVIISRFWGKKDLMGIKKHLGISFVFSMLVTSLFSFIAFFYPTYIIEIFSKEKAIVDLGANYLKMVSLSYIFTSISFNYYVALRSTEQTKFLMKGSLIGFVFNAVFNYLLIFGKFSFPAMGVTGAALATTIARGIELSYLVYIVHVKNNIIKPVIRDIISFKKEDLKLFMKIVYPVILNDVVWVFGITLYTKAYSLLGTGAIATMQIVNTVINVFYIFGIGIGVASSILLGRNIGEGKGVEIIQNIGKMSNRFSAVVGIFIGIILFLLSPFINSLFNTTPEIKKNVADILIIMSLILPFRFYGFNIVIGTFRGGGDVMFATLAEFSSTWLVAIPITFFTIMYLNVESIVIVYLCVCIDDISKIIISYPRLRTTKWIKSLE